MSIFESCFPFLAHFQTITVTLFFNWVHGIPTELIRIEIASFTTSITTTTTSSSYTAHSRLLLVVFCPGSKPEASAASTTLSHRTPSVYLSLHRLLGRARAATSRFRAGKSHRLSGLLEVDSHHQHLLALRRARLSQDRCRRFRMVLVALELLFLLDMRGNDTGGLVSYPEADSLSVTVTSSSVP